MFDILPYPPPLLSSDPDFPQAMTTYVTQLKSRLEEVLTSIGTDNLSPGLLDELQRLGANIQRAAEDSQEQLGQVSQGSITVADVVNSEQFKNSTLRGVSVNGVVLPKNDQNISDIAFSIRFQVNYETGELEYQIGG